MNKGKRPARNKRSGTASAANRHEGAVPFFALPIPDTCAGGAHDAGGDCVECLGTAFHCEYLTAIDNRWFCHHPRAQEIAARTSAARQKAARSAPWLTPAEMGRCLGKIFGVPPC